MRIKNLMNKDTLFQFKYDSLIVVSLLGCTDW